MNSNTYDVWGFNESMAKLLQPSYRCGPRDRIDFDEEKKDFDELQDNYPVVRWHVADGYAHYRVICLGENPVLQHVDYMDGYSKSGIFISGLKSANLKDQLSQMEIENLPKSIDAVDETSLPNAYEVNTL